MCFYCTKQLWLSFSWLALGCSIFISCFQPQDPGYFGEEVAIPSREVLNVRYKLLPYLYTLFYKAHTEGSTVTRPLVHE